MASWIVHLRIAEKLLEYWPALDPAQFAVGNVAPDSGIPDEKWETFTPPPAVTHFAATDGSYDSGPAEFYRRYLARKEAKMQGADLAFLLGYYCHLETDIQWSQRIGVPTKQRWAAEFERNPGFIWEVKGDWYGLDFCYVRVHPECLFWRTFLSCGWQRPACLDFLPGEALRQRVEYIRSYYLREDAEIQAMLARSFIYLSQAQMDAFVDSTVALLANSIQELIHEFRELHE
jgi:hypothetical protein